MMMMRDCPAKPLICTEIVMLGQVHMPCKAHCVGAGGQQLQQPVSIGRVIAAAGTILVVEQRNVHRQHHELLLRNVCQDVSHEFKLSLAD
jgi:hypothetical protein